MKFSKKEEISCNNKMKNNYNNNNKFKRFYNNNNNYSIKKIKKIINKICKKNIMPYNQTINNKSNQIHYKKN